MRRTTVLTASQHAASVAEADVPGYRISTAKLVRKRSPRIMAGMRLRLGDDNLARASKSCVHGNVTCCSTSHAFKYFSVACWLW
jgi:hypothetical protein